jgi:hypothetical protein
MCVFNYYINYNNIKLENKLRFYNICIEGPDCSGKTTLYNEIHKQTNFKFNIQDRSYLSMKVYSELYNRDDVSFWNKLFWKDIKTNNTLYVILLPSIDIIKGRLSKRGDEFQDDKSIIKLYEIFKSNSEVVKNLPQVIILKDIDVNENIKSIINRLEKLNSLPGSLIITDTVMGSGFNELVDIEITESLSRETLRESVMFNPLEREYYEKILEDFTTSIEKKLIGLTGKIQDLNSRQFVYSSDSCISMIHIMFREDKFNIEVTMRSSNVLHTLWSDYEFLKILCFSCADIFELWTTNIDMRLRIRSAHMIP